MELWGKRDPCRSHKEEKEDEDDYEKDEKEEVDDNNDDGEDEKEKERRFDKYREEWRNAKYKDGTPKEEDSRGRKFYGKNQTLSMEAYVKMRDRSKRWYSKHNPQINAKKRRKWKEDPNFREQEEVDDNNDDGEDEKEKERQFDKYRETWRNAKYKDGTPKEEDSRGRKSFGKSKYFRFSMESYVKMRDRTKQSSSKYYPQINAKKRRKWKEDPNFREQILAETAAFYKKKKQELTFVCDPPCSKRFPLAFSLERHKFLCHPSVENSSLVEKMSKCGNPIKTSNFGQLSTLTMGDWGSPKTVQDNTHFMESWTSFLDNIHEYTFYMCIGVKIDKGDKLKKPSELPKLLRQKRAKGQQYTLYIGSATGNKPYCPMIVKNVSTGHPGSLLKLHLDGQRVFAVYKETFSGPSHDYVRRQATFMEGAVLFLAFLRNNRLVQSQQPDYILANEVAMNQQCKQIQQMQEEWESNNGGQQADGGSRPPHETRWDERLLCVARSPEEFPLIVLNEDDTEPCKGCLCWFKPGYCVANFHLDPNSITEIEDWDLTPPKGVNASDIDSKHLEKGDNASDIDSKHSY